MESILAFQKLLVPTNPLLRACVPFFTRSLLTQAVEPPIDTTVPERPCTVILSEHADLYDGSSWHETCQQRLPIVHGMVYRQWSMCETIETVDDALNQMTKELGNTPDAVLIARGPWMSWLAQFFLESLPLAGLVMVDPLPLDDQNGVNQFELAYKNKQGLQGSTEFRLFQEFVSHWDHWSLKLEPGSVPMMVLHTFPRPVYKKYADMTAARHNSDHFGHVPVLSLRERDPEKQAENAITAITEWIDERVL